ncbi:hypothetical protein ACFOSC_31005 [Streptantibioticus rubrisoli]|uniref:Uncharacterized protein n=1 Tax=Streptantibioticus rubrisoli TaxID=1387313 RepID=A0ABT1PHF8_9ACTN|nr:hypothetical protein [Streptantibioticus rubrisoli]MCQ4044801.1 hypothetical protein [Streptantibioticus rubrisoli]
MDVKAKTGTEPGNKRIDLSLPQVAGSGAAALVAAYLASFLGVYGTILGAAVVSVLATTGGAIFQHLFRRTGEQLRDATAPLARSQNRRTNPADDATTVLPAYARTRADDSTAVVPRAEPDTALLMPRLPHDESYNESTLHGTRWRGWRRSLLAAGAVFGLAMGVFTGIELATGTSLSHTAVGQAVQGGGTRHAPSTPGHQQSTVPSADSSEPGANSGSIPSHDPTAGTGTSGSTPSERPSATPSQGGGAVGPSASPSQAPSPGPSHGPGSGTGDSGGAGQGAGGGSARPGAAQQAPGGGSGTGAQ